MRTTRVSTTARVSGLVVLVVGLCTLITSAALDGAGVAGANSGRSLGLLSRHAAPQARADLARVDGMALPLRSEAVPNLEPRDQAAANSPIPTWTLSNEYPTGSGNVFTDSLVGTDPSGPGAGTTTVPSPVVGLQVSFVGGTQTDASTAASDCGQSDTPVQLALGSPVFQDDVSGTQFADSFVRASFASDTAASGPSPDYHVLLTGSNPANESLSAPSDSFTGTQGLTCGIQGVLDGAWLRNMIETHLIPQLTVSGAVSTSTFPIFLTYNTALCEPNPASPGNLDPTTCGLGEHVSYQTASGATQTYAIVDYQLNGLDPAVPDSEPLAHEVAEWVDDPFADNLAPTWGYVGQFLNSDGTGECSPLLEVADPLTAADTQTIGSSPVYHVPDVAFPSWFFRSSPSTGAGGSYSLYGTFTSPSSASACPAQPISVQATAGDGSATVSWTQPPGGSDVEVFAVCSYPAASIFDIDNPCPSPDATETDFDGSVSQGVVTGLADGSSYVFRVFAVHCIPSDCSGGADLSTPSNASPAVTPQTPSTTTTSPPTTTSPTTPTSTSPTTTSTSAPSGSRGSGTTTTTGAVTGASHTVSNQVVSAPARALAFTGAGSALRLATMLGAASTILGALLLAAMGAPAFLRRRLAHRRR